jgi:hypothetical protein
VFEDTDSNEQWEATLDKELWGCLLCVLIFWRKSGLCVTRIQCVSSSSYLHGLVHCHLCCWTVGWWSRLSWFRWPTYSYRQSASSLRCHLFGWSHTWVYFHKYKYMFLVQNRLSGTTVPVLALSLWEYLPWLNVTSSSFQFQNHLTHGSPVHGLLGYIMRLDKFNIQLCMDPTNA